jgi:glycosyltransferase involved in cell wall biosynthesis
MSALGSARVILAPASYYIDGGHRGSEAMWAHEIIRYVAPSLRELTAITGYIVEGHLPANVRVVEVLAARRGEALRVDRASFVFDFMRRYMWAAARELRSRRYDLYHHLLPFAVHRSVNVVPYLRPGLPLVVGPVLGVVNPQPYGELMVGQSANGKGSGGYGAANSLERTARLLGSVLTRANHALLGRADAVIAAGPVAAKMIEPWVRRERIHIVPPGCDIERFVRRPSRDDGQVRLLAAGYLVRRKRNDSVLRALRRLLDGGVDARLLVVGDGPEEPALRRLAEELGIESRVEWLGFVPHSKIDDVYRRADVLVSGSEHEGVPIALLEALASGLPIVSARNQGSESLQEMGAPVFLSAVDDDAEMSRAIGAIARREDLERLAAEARAYAVTHFDWRHLAGRYVEIYRSVLGASPDQKAAAPPIVEAGPP